MAFSQTTLSLKTAKPIEFIEVTHPVEEFVKSLKKQSGLLVVASAHTTLGVVVNEACEALQKDMESFLKRLVPPQEDYHHNQVATDGRPNAHSHLLSLMIPNQVTLVVQQGQLELGSWQSIFAVELDGPRETRRLTVTFSGE